MNFVSNRALQLLDVCANMFVSICMVFNIHAVHGFDLIHIKLFFLRGGGFRNSCSTQTQPPNLRCV